jgi:hypothetical protein
MKTMRAIFLLAVASSVACQQLPLNYSAKLTAGDGAGMCPDAQDLRETIEQDIRSLINSNVLSALGTAWIRIWSLSLWWSWMEKSCLSQYA